MSEMKVVYETKALAIKQSLTPIAQKDGKRRHRPIYPTIEDAWAVIIARPWDENTKGCWLWTGAKRSGRGVMHVAGHTFYIYRIAASIRFGINIFDRSAKSLHSCDEPACFNPAHLFIGSQLDNVRDMMNKGRGNHVGSPGEKNPSATLRKEHVIAIRQERHQGTLLRVLADKYGVSQTQVSRIAIGKSWKNLEVTL